MTQSIELAPIRVVCPLCHGPLTTEPLTGEIAQWKCQPCQRTYPSEHGFPDLIIGGRFDDAPDEGLSLYEEQCNEDTTRKYWIPTIQRLMLAEPQPRVLSLGCGTGIDVDLMAQVGFSPMGIDCGNRSKMWPRRQRTDRLVLANGKHLPFEDGTFDVVFCGCVFPHVGVEGDSYQVTPGYWEERLNLAREMTRVLKPGGQILVSSPNRLFPCDLFHGREAGSYKPRPYWPGDPFLLSVADYRRLFQQAGCQTAKPLPVEDYWGFIRAKHNWKGRVLRWPVQTMFWLASREPLRFLRASPLNPWIVVAAQK